MAQASPPIRYTAADDTDFSAGTRVLVSNARNLKGLSYQPVWANYTAVTVKLQATNDEITAAASATWADVAGATTSTSGDIVEIPLEGGDAHGPWARYALHITATSSGDVDTMTIRVVEAPK